MAKKEKSRKKNQPCKGNQPRGDEVVQKHEEDIREIENLMRHDGYRRSRGGIRQTRRG